MVTVLIFMKTVLGNLWEVLMLKCLISHSTVNQLKITNISYNKFCSSN